MITAIVPVKNLGEAKQRLSEMLSPEQRRALAHGMLLDVFKALRRTDCLDSVCVVTPDASVQRLAARMGFQIIQDQGSLGETAVVSSAIESLLQMGAKATLVLPADIPAIRAEDVEQIAQVYFSESEAKPPPPSVVIVPSRDGTGTNAVLCSPPDAIPLRFGPNSFPEHTKRARENGVHLSVLRLPRVALDLDTPEDLRCFLGEKAAEKTHTYLELKRILGGGGQEFIVLPRWPARFA